jgi:hypothetical protein
MPFQRNIYRNGIIERMAKSLRIKINSGYGIWRNSVMSYDGFSSLAKVVPRKQASTPSSTS